MKKIILTLVVLLIVSGLGYVGYLRWEENNYNSNISGITSNERSVVINKDELKCKDCNLIMISLSNVSAEHMSLYGYERLTTPNIDKWAKDAIVFENAFTQASWTLPVGTSLFTGLYPYTHGVKNRYVDNVLSENIKTLPEILKEDGYETQAFTGGLDYSKNFGHMRGFDEVVEVNDGVIKPAFESNFDEIFKRSSMWLGENSNQKFFLFIHGYDAHCPFIPPQEFKGIFSKKTNKNSNFSEEECYRGYKNSENDNEFIARYYKNIDDIRTEVLNKDDVEYLKDLYDEEILSVDKLLIDFLNEIDKEVLDKTIVVIFSDHGEMFARHGRFGRAGSIRGALYDEVLHIPLVIKVPNMENKKISGLAQIIDIMPTSLNLLGVPFDNELQGKDLRKLIRGADIVNEYVYTGIEYYGSKYFDIGKTVNESIRSEEWKLIREIDETGKENIELFNISNDIDEMNNLAILRIDKLDELKKELEIQINNQKNFFTINSKITKELPNDFIEDAKRKGYW